MSDLHHNPTPGDERVWVRRSAALGCPAVVVDLQGNLLEQGGDPRILDWLTSPGMLETLIRQARSRDRAPIADVLTAMTVTRLSPGGRAGWLIALARHADALPDWLPEPVRNAIESMPVRQGRAIRDMERQFRWCYSDRRVIEHNTSTSTSLSDEVAVAYEQLSLLHGLSATAEGVQHPADTTKQACEELAATGRFAWAAARFADHASLGRTIAGRLIVSGVSPVRGEVRLASDMIAADFTGALEAGQKVPGGPRDSRLGVIAAYPIKVSGKVGGVLLAARPGDDPDRWTTNELMVLRTAAASLSALAENCTLYHEQHQMFVGMLEALSASIDAKDPYTRGHSQRVADMGKALAQRAGMSPDQCERVWIAGLVHDIGKIGVPEATLRKPGKLTEAEFAQIRKHPQIGYNILRDIPNFADVLPGVLSHHEQWDGSGYPHGLAGEEIPLIARVLGLADAFDAMSSRRTYRSAMNRQQVLDEIRQCSGTHFDPSLVEVFLALDFSHYDQMVASHPTMGEQSVTMQLLAEELPSPDSADRRRRDAA